MDELQKTSIEMEEAAKEARRAYFNDYRKKNPDKIKQWSHNYWVRKAQRMKEEREREQKALEA